MSRRKEKRSLVSMFLIFVLLLPFIGIIIELFVDTGIFHNIWVEFIENIPFGGFIGKMALELFSKFIPVAVDSQAYLSGAKEIHGILEFLQEFGKLFLTATIYGMLEKIFDVAMELTEESAVIAFIKNTISHMVAVFLAAILVGPLLQFAFGQINQLKSLGAQIMTSVILIISLIGAMGIYAFLLSATTGLVIGYVLVKLVLMNLVDLLFSSLCLTFILLNIAEKTWELALLGMGGWIAVLILLVAIDLMLSSVFD